MHSIATLRPPNSSLQLHMARVLKPKCKAASTGPVTILKYLAGPLQQKVGGRLQDRLQDVGGFTAEPPFGPGIHRKMVHGLYTSCYCN